MPDGSTRRPSLKKRMLAAPKTATSSKNRPGSNRAAHRDPDAPLTDRAWAMLRHYLAMPEPSQFEAYKMAGYAGRGQSGRSAANEIFTSLNFQKALLEQIKARQQRLVVEGDLIIRNMLNMASSNMLDYCDWTADNVVLKPSCDLSRDQAFAIVEISEHATRDGKLVKIRLADKIRSNELLMTHLGLLIPDSERGQDPSVKARQLVEAVHALLGSVPSRPPSTPNQTPSPTPTGSPEDIEEPVDNP